MATEMKPTMWVRPIFGELNTPHSAYILVVRISHPDGLRYFEHHKKTYPNWGCIVFPDKYFAGLPYLEIPKMTAIHQICSAEEFISASDEVLIEYVKTRYPMYFEDDDPIVISESPLLKGLDISNFVAYDPESLYSLIAPPTHPMPVINRKYSMRNLFDLFEARGLKSGGYISEDDFKEYAKKLFVEEIFSSSHLWDITIEHDSRIISVSLKLPLR